MSIRIDDKTCIGCQKCNEQCPGNLLAMNSDNKAYIRDVRDCWGCCACVKACPVNAIHFFLGADVGGDGTTMTVKPDGSVLHWQFRFPDGTSDTVDTDRTQSNKY